MNKKEGPLTVPEFADALADVYAVSHETVRRWVREGKLKATKQGPFHGKTSPILIPRSELERVKKLMETNDSNNGHSDQS